MTTREEAQGLRDQGLSLAEIGQRFGVSRQRIHQLLDPEGNRAVKRANYRKKKIKLGLTTRPYRRKKDKATGS